MRQQDQQIDDDQRADRTPVQAGDRDRTDDLVGTDNLVGSDDPNRADKPNRTDGRDRADDLDRVEYHEPAPLPTTFGAPTVSGAVAASALASGDRTKELDAREDSTVAPDNGAVDNTAVDKGSGGDGAGPLLDTETTERLRKRWRDMQLRFVDDPAGALGEARGLVDEAVQTLTTALTEQRGRLDDDGGTGTDTGETERIRLTIRRYRDFLDRVLDR